MIAQAVEQIRNTVSLSVLDETATKQGVVLNLLSLAGWDTFDVSQVVPEYRVGNRRVDYALGPGSPNAVFIEVKRPGENLERHQQQLQEARALQQSAAYDEYRARRVVAEHRLARLVQLGIRQSRYFGRVKTRFQLYLAATVANLTLVLGNIGLSGSAGGGAEGHRVVLDEVHAVVANAAANFSAVRLGQLLSLILLTPTLLPKSLYPTRAFRPGF